MTQKNKEIKERKERRIKDGSFIGCRPTRFADKTKYTRKGRKKGQDYD